MTYPLATFGDSWPAGEELKAGEQSFGHKLAELLGSIKYTNCAVAATSNEHMILQLEQYIKRSKDVTNHIAIFFVTETSRSCLIDHNGDYLEIKFDGTPAVDSIDYYYFKYFHTPAQEKFKTHQTILALQRMSAEFKLNDFYIVGWQSNIDLDWPGIQKDKFYDHGKTTCADWMGVPQDMFWSTAKLNPYVRPNINHPNQLGHWMIANKLYEWIKNKIV
jgi:hypothetical protein